MQGFKKRICAAAEGGRERLQAVRQEKAAEEQKDRRKKKGTDPDKKQSHIPPQAVKKSGTFVVHFYESQSTAVLFCRFDAPIEADFINVIAEEQGKKQMGQFVNGRPDQIEKVKKKLAACLSVKILPGRLPGAAHEKAEDHQNEQDFNVNLDKIIKHDVVLAENISCHIIHMKKRQESLSFLSYKYATELC